MEAKLTFHLHIASSAASNGLILLDTPFPIYLDTAALPEGYAADGSPTSQRLDEDR